MRAESDVPLAPLTTLGVGGPAPRLVTAEAAGELPQAVDSPAPILLLAGGSNVVLPDAGWPEGTVVRLATRGVRHEDGPDGAVRLMAAAGEPWEPLVAAAVEDGLVGVEALSGIPGSTGATPIQNVGAYGQGVAQTGAAVPGGDRAGERERGLAPADCRFAYRRSALKGQDRLIVTEVAFDLDRGDRGSPVAYAELARTLGIEIGERAPLGAVRE